MSSAQFLSVVHRFVRRNVPPGLIVGPLVNVAYHQAQIDDDNEKEYRAGRNPAGLSQQTENRYPRHRPGQSP